MELPLDKAGGMLVGGALVMLFSRLTLALLKRHAINEVRTQHFTEAARQRNSIIGRARAVFDAVPPRLRYGLAMGLAGAVVPFTFRRLSNSIFSSTNEDGSVESGSALGRAFFMAAKWLVLGAILQSARRFGVQRLLNGRRAANPARGG